MTNRTRTNGAAAKGKKITEVALFFPDEVIHGPRLGKGSFGDVYEVLAFKTIAKNDRQFSGARLAARRHYSNGGKERASRSNNQKYAIKCLRDDFVKPSTFRSAAKDMGREVDILSTSDHPFIIKVYARSASGTKAATCTKEEAHNFFIVMDRLTGTLNEKITFWKREKQRTMITPLFFRGRNAHVVKKKALLMERFRVAADIASAIAYLHTQRIVYRDLKADNVGFDLEGEVKLFDFGLARRFPSDPAKKKMNDTYVMSGKTGSLILMAPEVFKGKPYNEKADVYSFAMLLWNMLALDLPYLDFIRERAFEEKVMEKGLRPELKGTWPKKAQILLQKGWAKDYNDRPTMKEVCGMLKEVIAPPEAPTSTRSRGYVSRSSFGY